MWGKIFFLVLHACSLASHSLHALANVFKKNEKKNKTTSVYRLGFSTYIASILRQTYNVTAPVTALY